MTVTLIKFNWMLDFNLLFYTSIGGSCGSLFSLHATYKCRCNSEIQVDVPI
jgi:hypothetical protein